MITIEQHRAKIKTISTGSLIDPNATEKRKFLLELKRVTKKVLGESQNLCLHLLRGLDLNQRPSGYEKWSMRSDINQLGNLKWQDTAKCIN